MQVDQDWQRASLYMKFVFAMYALFLAGYFLVPQAPEHYEFYYLLVLAPSLLLWPAAAQLLRGNALFLLMMVYILYMMVTSLWSPVFDWQGFVEVVWHGLLVVSFILLTAVLRENLPDSYERMLRMLVFVAAFAGLLSITLWYSDHPFPASRMKPFGRMEWEIRAAGVYGLFWIMSLYFFTRTRGKFRWVYLFAGLPLLMTVMFTQTRTALIAMAAAGVVIAIRHNYRVLLVFIAAAAITLLVFPELWEQIMRGMPFRVSIWTVAFEQAREHWLFGNGYLSDTTAVVAGVPFEHAHNMYIATFRDGGVVGLGLMLAMLGVALLWAFRLARRCGDGLYLALLLYLFINSIPNPDRLLARPHEQWLFIWLPLILVMVDYYRNGPVNNSQAVAQAPADAGN